MELGLTAFIADHVRRPWQPGHVDCLMAIADWMIAKGYSDPVAEFRGTYETEDEGFSRVIAPAGGVVPLLQSFAPRIGVERVPGPEIGFIGVVGSRKDIGRQFGAIYAGKGRWYVRMIDGYPAVRCRPHAIWAI